MTAPADRWRSSRRGWAITAAVLAATVCLACWPRPTLGVLGIVVGTGALLAGLRGLLAEHHSQAPTEPSDDPTAQETRDLADDRCCVCGGPDTPYENHRGQLFCWPCADCPCDQVPCVRTGINDPAVSSAAAKGPTCQCAGVGFGGRGDCPVHDGPTTADASGRAPETARQHPDASAEQPADQGGDHPDDLRNRLADALRTALKERTIPPLTLYGHQASPGIGLSVHDLADIALAELAPELDALTAARAGDGPWLRAYREDLIAAQNAIHRITGQAQDWAQLAPPNDTAYANAGRIVLDLLREPSRAEGA